ncbi:MAG: hypothetical protein AAF202_02945, partial [Pseudomonadota bacterium]
MKESVVNRIRKLSRFVAVLVVCVLTSVTYASSAQSSSTFGEDGKTLTIPDSIYSLLTEEVDKDFRLYDLEQYAPSIQKLYSAEHLDLPFATEGDFNGDGQKDLALMGYTTAAKASRTYVVVITSHSTAPAIV